MTLTEEQRGTVGFDLEKARASISHYRIENPSNVDTESALKELVDQANLAEEYLAEIERLRADLEQSEICIRARMECIDDQAAYIKELESSLDEAEALTKKNAELMNGYLGRIKVLEKNCIYDPGDGKIFVPDGHPEIERLRARVVALEDALAEYQRLGKIISESVIPCLTVHGNCDQCRPKTKAACEAIAAIHKGKIGPDARPPCWQITEDQARSIQLALNASSTLDHRARSVLRAMLEEDTHGKP